MSASPSASPAPAPAPAQSNKNKDIYDNVFGGDLSDLSSEDEGPSIPKRKGFPPRPAPASDDDDDDAQPAGDASDEDDDEEGDYVPGTVNSAAKIPKFKKRAVEDMNGEEDEGRVKERKKKTKKHKGEKRRRSPAEGEVQEEDDMPVLDEATRTSPNGRS